MVERESQNLARQALTFVIIADVAQRAIEARNNALIAIGERSAAGNDTSGLPGFEIIFVLHADYVGPTVERQFVPKRFRSIRGEVEFHDQMITRCEPCETGDIAAKGLVFFFVLPPSRLTFASRVVDGCRVRLLPPPLFFLPRLLFLATFLASDIGRKPAHFDVALMGLPVQRDVIEFSDHDEKIGVAFTGLIQPRPFPATHIVQPVVGLFTKHELRGAGDVNPPLCFFLTRISVDQTRAMAGHLRDNVFRESDRRSSSL